MAKLTTKGRKAIATKNFAGPDRSYPIEDASHARNALARVSQHGSPAVKAEVRAKVHAKYPGIGKGNVDRSSHHDGNPGFPSTKHAGTSPPFYSNEPHAPANKVADKPLIPNQNASLGNEPPKMVAKPHTFGKPPIGGSHGYGHGVHQRVGGTRISGHPSAHRIGKR